MSGLRTEAKIAVTYAASRIESTIMTFAADRYEYPANLVPPHNLTRGSRHVRPRSPTMVVK